MTAPVVVIGAGIGGLCAAVRLASRGVPVEVVEAAPGPGGKAGITVLDGVEVDTGPSVLTLPEVFDRVFAGAGTSLEAQVTLRRPDPAFRYIYPDGPTLDVYHRPADTLDQIRDVLGASAADEMQGFLRYAEQIWEASAPNFVFGAAPSFGTLLGLSVTRMGDLRRIDATRSMWAAIERAVRSRPLRWLLARYATYNGSDVFRAPATLNCIAWVELGLGGFGVEGGIHSLVRALVRVAEGLGVTFTYGTPVRGIETDGRRVTGVRTDAGRRVASAVVANADAAHVRESLLPAPADRAVPAVEEPSTSGWNAVLRARRTLAAGERLAHTVVFPERYEEEFRDLFERGRPPRDPTVYLCAQAVCHGRDAWPDAEPVFVMANAPAEPAVGRRDPAAWAELEAAVRRRATSAGVLGPEDRVLWRRTPADLAAQFPGSRGALYGGASNARFAAFSRPPNRVRKVPGLYLASGSAHPGGGLPLCAQSGLTAADELLAAEAGVAAPRRSA